jgi:hypothetical protein
MVIQLCLSFAFELTYFVGSFFSSKMATPAFDVDGGDLSHHHTDDKSRSSRQCVFSDDDVLILTDCFVGLARSIDQLQNAQQHHHTAHKGDDEEEDDFMGLTHQIKQAIKQENLVDAHAALVQAMTALSPTNNDKLVKTMATTASNFIRTVSMKSVDSALGYILLGKGRKGQPSELSPVGDRIEVRFTAALFGILTPVALVHAKHGNDALWIHIPIAHIANGMPSLRHWQD